MGGLRGRRTVPGTGRRPSLCLEVCRLRCSRGSVPALRIEGLARGRAPLFAGFALVFVHVFLQQLQVALGH